MTFHLHIHSPDKCLEAVGRTEVADCVHCDGDMMATITADEKPEALTYGRGASRLKHTQCMRLIRKLVNDANAAQSMRRELRAIFDAMDDRYCGAPDSPTRWMGPHLDGIRAALLRDMTDAELDAKLTSDKVIDGLARDIMATKPGDPIGSPGDDQRESATRLEAMYGPAVIPISPIRLVPDNRAVVDPDTLMRRYAQRVIGMVNGAMGLGTPASIAAHPDGMLSHDDTAPSEAEDATDDRTYDDDHAGQRELREMEAERRQIGK